MFPAETCINIKMQDCGSAKHGTIDGRLICRVTHMMSRRFFRAVFSEKYLSSEFANPREMVYTENKISHII